MSRFHVRQSSKLQLASYSGLALIGQCCEAAQLEVVIDPRVPVSQGIRTSDIVKSTIGLRSLGKNDFEAIEPFRHDWFFKEALCLSKIPGSVWMRQRLDAKAGAIRELADELSLRLIERTEAPITAHKGYTCADLDTFVMDNSDTHKVAVSRTYQEVDGYTPIVLYLGNEGWNIGLELSAGSHHSALETEYFLERAFPRLQRLCANDAKVLWRDDSAFDSARLLLAKAAECERWAGLGRSFDFITKWNPRRQDKDAWVAKTEAAKAMINDAVQANNDPEATITLGADKGYDAREFIDALTDMNVIPHVAQNTSGRRSAVPDEIANTEGYSIWQQKRKLIEQSFGWAKTIGNMRQVMVRGLQKVDQMFVLTMAAYNLTRMRTLGQLRPEAAQ